jgi:nitroimidazol reductase NimA-like FMN-containing flavoprotein (pyridoxamine 5'-phosphate oxidase superfamily)
MSRQVREYIEAARVCRIATVRDDGGVHLIPVCPVFDGERLYIDIGENDVTARDLRRDARITVLIDDYDDDWTKLKKVMLYCTARAADADEQARAWDLIRAKFPQYTTVGWRPRHTMALTIDRWRQEGVERPPGG